MFYVYYLINPLTDEIFYIGKGKDNRMYDHFKPSLLNKNTKKNNKIKKILEETEYTKYDIAVKHKIFNTEKEAFEYEKYIINEIGIEKLCNMTEGGEGISGFIMPSYEIDRRREFFKTNNPTKGRKLTDEHKRKISESRKGVSWGKHKEETKNKMRKLRGKYHPNYGKRQSEETINKKNEKIRKIFYLKSPEEEKIKVNNLKKFCENNNLSLNSIRKVLSEKCIHNKSHKGWTKWIE